MKGQMVLLIEDNEQIMRGNERMLKRRGYVVITALTIAQASRAIEKQMPDILVLDIMMPDGSGLDFMSKLRKHSQVPILLLTGLTTPEDIVRGLTRGGDDYLAKPYDFGVLLARIEALLRRAGHIPERLKKGGLQFDIASGRVFLGGSDLLLTQKEFALLLVMARNEGHPLSPEYLYETVWKLPMGTDDSAVKTAVSRLRKKIGDSCSIHYDGQEEGYVLKISVPADPL